MWHYAKAAERGPRVTQIMSAPGRLRAGCFGIGVRLAAGIRLPGTARLTGSLRSPLLSAAARVLRLSRCGRSPWRRRLRRLSSTNINVNRKRVVGLTAFAGRASPRPRCTGCAISAPCGPSATNRFNSRRLMAVAAAVSMMRDWPIGTSQRGGSVYGPKMRVGAVGLRCC